MDTPNFFLARALALIALLFSAGCGNKEETERPAAQGARGESCEARNDCESGLACINNLCVQNEYSISPSARQCDLIGCSADEDCCDIDGENCDELSELCEFAPGYDASCAAAEAACDGGAGDGGACDRFFFDCECYATRQSCEEGDQFACDSVEFACRVSAECTEYLSECVCASDCVDNSCFDAVACFTDSQCIGGECSNGTCDFGCASDADCDEGATCTDGFCVDGCADRNDCGFFADCVNSTCVDVGCATDRECVAFTSDAFATCNDGECVVPCLNDAECNPNGYDFQACVSGNCTFVGCETDEECHTVFTRRLGSLDRGVSALCREAP